MFQKVAMILLGAAVVLAPVMVGSVHTVTAGVLCAIVSVAAMVTWFARDEANGSWFSLIWVAFALLAMWSALQLVPLPLAVLDVLQSTGAQWWDKGWELAVSGEAAHPPPWRPLSLDPAATADRGLRWTTLALAAWTAANIPDSRRWRPIYIMLLASGAVALITGSVVRVTDPTSFFGLYEPTIPFRGPSPFVSTNHAASFYGICGLVGLGGLALRRDGHQIEASIAGVLGLVFLAMAAVHDSDAVMASLGLAVAFFVGGFVLRTERGAGIRERLQGQVGRIAYGGIAAICLILLGWWLGVFELLSGVILSPLEGSESALNRGEIALAALGASTDYIATGSGGGSVDVVITRYIDWDSLRPASIPVVENDPVEWLLTYGWPVGGVAIALFAVSIALVVRRGMSRARGERWLVGGALFIFAAGISLFHFPFLALGIALPLIVALEGMTAPRNPPRKPGKAGKGWSFNRSAHVGLGRKSSTIVLVVLLLLAAIHGWAHRAWSADMPSGYASEAADLVRARPTDGRVYAELARRALEADEWERARELARHSATLDTTPDAQIFLARVLGATDRDSEAAAIYSELLSSPIPSRIVRPQWIGADLEEAEDRALALATADGEQLRRAIAVIERVEGPEAATETVLALSDIRGDDPTLHRSAVSVFIALGSIDLAEVWADSVDANGLTEGGHAVGPELKVAVERARGDQEAVRRIAASSLDAGDASERVARAYLDNLPDILDASSQEAARVSKALEIVCTSPIPANFRRPCWLGEAWAAEQAGEFSDAELVFQRIASRLDAPTHLAHFLSRHGKCLDIQRLKQELPDGRDRKAVGQIAGQCRSGSEKLTPRKGR